MDDFENHVIDVLRKLQDYEPKGFFSITTIIKNHYSNRISPKLADFLYLELQKRDLAFTVEEDNRALINESGKLLLEKILTSDYILDRVMDFLFKHSSSPRILPEVLQNLNLKIHDPERAILEAKVIKSGFVDYTKASGAYNYTLKINPEGLVALSTYEKYSDFLKQHKPPSGTIRMPGRLLSKEEYRFLEIFPVDQTFLSFDEILSKVALLQMDYNDVNRLLDALRTQYLTRDRNKTMTFSINSKGLIALKEFKEIEEEQIYQLTGQTTAKTINIPLNDTFEIIFQKHKQNSGSLRWTKETFKPDVPDNLESAKQLLLKKGIIFFASNGKSTVLAPEIIELGSYAEANKVLAEDHNKAYGPSINVADGGISIIGSEIKKSKFHPVVNSPALKITKPEGNNSWLKTTLSWVFEHVILVIVLSVVAGLIVAYFSNWFGWQ